MAKLWALLSTLRSLSGPALMLLYPLHASVKAIESETKTAGEDEQWLAYWILYSLITLMEMMLSSVLQWIPVWYEVKLVLVAWLVLPQFKGAAFTCDRVVRLRILGWFQRKRMQQQQQL